MNWNRADRRSSTHIAGAATNPNQKMVISALDRRRCESPFLASNFHSETPSSLM